jgi:hypothetical protein
LASADGLKYVEDKFSISLSTWDVYFPVSGMLLHKKTKWAFGLAEFITTNNRSLLKLIKLNQPHLFELGPINCYLHLEVEASDHSSAINTSRPIADLHIAVLNALANIGGSASHNDPFSSYGNVGEHIHTCTLVRKNNLLGCSRSMSLNLAGFSPHVLTAHPFIKKFDSLKISKKLTDIDDSLYQKRLIPALKWLGKAISQNSEEEVFLYYCLAFEAILYESNFKENLMDNLRKRAYKLMFTSGNYLGGSVTAFNKFSYLYGIRSAIVHRGGTEVTEEDVKLIKDLVVGGLYKFFGKNSCSKFKTSEELEKWLEE